MSNRNVIRATKVVIENFLVATLKSKEEAGKTNFNNRFILPNISKYDHLIVNIKIIKEIFCFFFLTPILPNPVCVIEIGLTTF